MRLKAGRTLNVLRSLASSLSTRICAQECFLNVEACQEMRCLAILAMQCGQGRKIFTAITTLNTPCCTHMGLEKYCQCFNQSTPPVKGCTEPGHENNRPLKRNPARIMPSLVTRMVVSCSWKSVSSGHGNAGAAWDACIAFPDLLQASKPTSSTCVSSWHQVVGIRPRSCSLATSEALL